MTNWYITPKEWFKDKQQFEYAKKICEVFDAQEIIGIDSRDQERNIGVSKKRRNTRKFSTLYRNRGMPKNRG